jgi:flagellar biogenesis protein FliO
MSDVGLGDLLLRMVLSLVVVLGLVLGAYAILRRRQGTPSGRELRSERGERRTGLLGRTAGGLAPKSGNRRGLKIVGRVGVSRTTSVVAIQFADRVLMIGTSEQAAPSVLAELDLETWTASTATPDDLQPIARPSSSGPGGSAGTAGARRPSFLDALRDATTRRG